MKLGNELEVLFTEKQIADRKAKRQPEIAVLSQKTDGQHSIQQAPKQPGGAALPFRAAL